MGYIVANKNDWGTVIRVQFLKNGAPYPLAGADKLEIHLKKPNKSAVKYTATVYGDPNLSWVECTVPKDVLTIAGSWYVLGYVEFAAGAWFTDPYELLVGDTF